MTDTHGGERVIFTNSNVFVVHSFNTSDVPTGRSHVGFRGEESGPLVVRSTKIKRLGSRCTARTMVGSISLRYIANTEIRVQELVTDDVSMTRNIRDSKGMILYCKKNELLFL